MNNDRAGANGFPLTGLRVCFHRVPVRAIDAEKTARNPSTTNHPKPGGNNENRLIVALVGLAISFALPTFAQQTDTPDPQLRQQIVALTKKFDDAMNNNDASREDPLEMRGVAGESL
jgi:hypothetical protein